MCCVCVYLCVCAFDHMSALRGLSSYLVSPWLTAERVPSAHLLDSGSLLPSSCPVYSDYTELNTLGMLQTTLSLRLSVREGLLQWGEERSPAGGGVFHRGASESGHADHRESVLHSVATKEIV